MKPGSGSKASRSFILDIRRWVISFTFWPLHLRTGTRRLEHRVSVIAVLSTTAVTGYPGGCRLSSR